MIIPGISNKWSQDSQHIAMAEVRRRWGDAKTITDRITLRRLEWLGHLERMC